MGFPDHDANPLAVWAGEPLPQWLSVDRPRCSFRADLEPGWDFDRLHAGQAWMADRIAAQRRARYLTHRRGTSFGLVLRFRFDVWRPCWYAEFEAPDPSWVLRAPEEQILGDVQTWHRLGWQSELDPNLPAAWWWELWNLDGPTGPCAYVRTDRPAGKPPRLVVHHVLMDARNPDYQAWVVAQIAHAADRWGAAAVHIGLKQGWNEHQAWAHWSDPRGLAANPAHAQEAAYWKPLAAVDPASAINMPLTLPPYGPGEYEAACKAILCALWEQHGIGSYISEKPPGWKGYSFYIANGRRRLPDGGFGWDVWMDDRTRAAVIGYMP